MLYELTLSWQRIMIDFILSKNYRLSNDQITETYDSILQEGVAGPDQYHQEIYRS